MRVVIVVLTLLTGVVVSLMGFRGTVSERRPFIIVTDQVIQPRFEPQGESPFFKDGRMMRTPPAGTVPFGGADYESDAGSPRLNPDFLQEDDRYYRGKQGTAWVTKIPVKLDLELLRRGQERYEIYCSPCHGATGSGNGVMTQYGLVGVATITDAFHALMPEGEYFNVITNGKGRMLGYGPQIKVGDRWAIVAYIRALSRSQNAKIGDVPEAKRAELSQ
ncbi:MAG: cytochrome c [Isosphaeraceae bacterium]|jgi:mono/diheme cytochrome c family protein